MKEACSTKISDVLVVEQQDRSLTSFPTNVYTRSCLTETEPSVLLLQQMLTFAVWSSVTVPALALVTLVLDADTDPVVLAWVGRT